MDIEDLLGDEFRQLQREYVDQVRSSLEQMRRDMDQGDFTSVRRTAHSLKGSAGMFGYGPIGELGAQIEKAVLRDDRAAVPPLLEELQETFRKLMDRAA
jgi:HPt (histidine-containing phosphotransfer) domain-containing protein